MNPLEEIIRANIKSDGVIPFSQLMELALYCPQFGYYDRIENRIGQNQDYYTSVSVGPLFGQLLALQLVSWIEQMGLGDFQLLEAGAHQGQLARDILAWLESHRPELAKRLQYWILEPLATRRTSQQQTLESFHGRVQWFDRWEAVPQPGVRGAIFSNELLDAMPVHRLGWDAEMKEWFEWGVELKNGELSWARLGMNPRLVNPRLMAQLSSEVLAVLPDGFTTEVCPAALEWWQRAAKSLRQGRLLTFDYGLDAEEFFVPARSGGTLRAYHRHHLTSDLLARLGEQDLTAHVNFTAVQRTGEAAGLNTEIMESQTKFLTRIIAFAVNSENDFAPADLARQFHTLTHPEHLGRAFKVLVQSRLAPVKNASPPKSRPTRHRCRME